MIISLFPPSYRILCDGNEESLFSHDGLVNYEVAEFYKSTKDTELKENSLKRNSHELSGASKSGKHWSMCRKFFILLQNSIFVRANLALPI